MASRGAPFRFAQVGPQEIAARLTTRARGCNRSRASSFRAALLSTRSASNATPGARLHECPHCYAQLRSRARHCHPPVAHPAFMSRLKRFRLFGGNRAGLSRRGQGGLATRPSRRMGRICDRTIPLQARIFGMSEKPKFHSKMIKDGRWTVAIRTGYGPVSHVGNFATEEEANRWIATDSKNWPQPADNQSKS
jgi:hypothetical protein